MLLDEDPAALMLECVSNFNINPDRSALTRINESLTTLSRSRDLKRSDASASLKRVTRQLATLEQQHSLEVSAHNPAEHAQQILALDTRKFRVAKEASDLEIEGERLEGELAALEAQLDELERREGGRETEPGEELDVLKLKLYRSLGIDLEGDEHGNFKTAVVRSGQRGSAKIIDIDPRFSKNYYINQFWQAL